MYPPLDIDLDDLRLRTLTSADADLLVDATRNERGRALWGPGTVGAYSPADAVAALREWDPGSASQVSFGVLVGPVLVAAVGLMADGFDSAELAYWVRPERRGRGIGVRSVSAVTRWAHGRAGVRRVWLEIDPANAASLRVAERTGYRFSERMPRHCRSWAHADPDRDVWHDCLIWTHDDEPE